MARRKRRRCRWGKLKRPVRTSRGGTRICKLPPGGGGGAPRRRKRRNYSRRRSGPLLARDSRGRFLPRGNPPYYPYYDAHVAAYQRGY